MPRFGNDQPRCLVLRNRRSVRGSSGSVPDESLSLLAHPRDTVAVFLEGGPVRLRQADGAEDTMTHGAQDVVFIPAGTTHALSVSSGSPRPMFYDLKD